uniref:Bromodomain-containing protein 3 n=1 Tax=Phallusia mammillata TaxID=59560 RepID=A0A6F9D8B4_9ASCI|nr:bromodomain-containing protein 3 [Phallusia mammillata]
MDDENSNQHFVENVEKDVKECDSETEDMSKTKSHEVSTGLRIINEIIKQNKTICWPFMEPVDTEGLGLWDYELKIKEPMWLNKILENIDQDHYNSLSDIARDFRLMVENCYRYNTTDHPISKKAKRLEMFFESKLALLSRVIQDSVTVAKTSNGRFATKLENFTSENSRSTKGNGLSNGNSDYFNANDFDNQPHLVYDFVRCEEAVMAEDEKQASYRERKQQQALYQQVAAVFVNGLETPENLNTIKTCSVLPEIGLFFHLNEGLLKLPELSMYCLEMGLLIPSDSLYLAKVMTSFLSTYYERNLISQRQPMSFNVWNNRLKLKINKWFEVVRKHLSFVVAADKLCLSVEFFEALHWKNPFESEDRKTFLELSYYQKAQIIKALCDNQTSTQSVQNNIANLPSEQLRPMDLGEDVEGNLYIYFPQFCGDDVRIYRQRKYGDFTPVDCPVPEILDQSAAISLDNPVDKTSPVPINLLDMDIPPKENLDTSAPEVLNSEMLEDKSTLNEIPDRSSLTDEKNAENLTSNLSELVTTGSESVDDEIKQEDSELTMLGEEKTVLPDESNVQSCEEKDTVTKPSLDDVKLITDPNNDIANVFVENDPTSENKAAVRNEDNENDDSEIVSSPMDIKKEEEILTNFDDVGEISVASSLNTTQDEICESGADEQSIDKEYSPKTPKKRGRKKLNSIPDFSEGIRRSSRKRASVNYSKMMIEREVEEEKKPKVAVTPKKRGRKPAKKYRKPIPIEEPVCEFGTVDFEMVCDSINALSTLISTIEEERSKAIKVKKPSIITKNVTTLLERLRWLLDELLPWETRLEKAKFDAKIRLKKEHDEIIHKATTGNAFNAVDSRGDPWEEEISNKSALISIENSSTRSGTPNPLYLEESDSESDRELRRSKRKPKRYEEDEDYVCESSDDEMLSALPSSFMYDEFDEGRKRLLPAALDELEDVLSHNVPALKRIITRERQDDDPDGGAMALNERRTRQRSKRENKVFRKVLYLALKHHQSCGPSLLPLIRHDQVEITEVVDRILAKDAVARQQRKATREQEDRKRRLALQAQRQKTRLQQKKERKENAAQEECVEIVGETTWSPSKKPSLLADSPAYRVQDNETVENVIIRLQNGKVCPALRFTDGRIAPIVRVDNDTKPAASFDDLTSGFSRNKTQNAENKVPYISLTGNRKRALASILRKPTPKKQQMDMTTSEPGINVNDNDTTISASSASQAPDTSKAPAVCVQSVAKTNPVSVKFVHQSISDPPANNNTTTNLSSALTKPSGQFINLVLSNQARQQTTASHTSNYRASPTGVGSLGKFVVKVNPRVLNIARPLVSQQSSTGYQPVCTGSVIASKPVSVVGTRVTQIGSSVATGNAMTVMPQPSLVRCQAEPPSGNQQPQAYKPIQQTSVVAASALAIPASATNVPSQPTHQLRVLPTLVAPVPVVQPVHIVPTVAPQAMAIPVQTRPVLLVSSQARPAVNVTSYQPPPSLPSTSQQPQRYVFSPYSQGQGQA